MLSSAGSQPTVHNTEHPLRGEGHGYHSITGKEGQIPLSADEFADLPELRELPELCAVRGLVRSFSRCQKLLATAALKRLTSDPPCSCKCLISIVNSLFQDLPSVLQPSRSCSWSLASTTAVSGPGFDCKGLPFRCPDPPQ